MLARYSVSDALRGASVAAVGLLTLALLALLPRPGYQSSRLALFGVIAAVAWIGAAGALRERPRLTLAGAVGLFLLGFWQFTVGLAALPASAVLLLTALVSRGESADERSPAPA